MISKLLERRRFIAAFLLGIFYLDLVLPMRVHAGDGMPPSIKAYYSAGGNISELHDPAGAAFYNGDQYTHNDKTTGRPRTEDIGGPGQPEMNSFSSVNASNMVDLFTGDFSYNLPLMDVGGYPVNIHYSSGISMDQEASWVGLGWNVNPGTIGRTTRGLPDDFNGKDTITRTQNIKENKTVGANLGGSFEFVGFPATLGGHIGVFHNNYNGWGTENGVNASISVGSKSAGSLTGSLAINNNSQTGLDISPSLSVKLGGNDAALNGVVTVGSNYNSRAGISGLQLNTEVRANVSRYKEFTADIDGKHYSITAKVGNAFSTSAGIGSFISFATPSYLPTITMPLTTKSFTFKAQLGGEIWLLDPHAYIEGYVSRQYIRPEDATQKLPAYGYLYFSEATQPKVLLDFNREKEVAFNVKSTPHIAIPQYDYDIYSVSGEGTGGMFRPYRSDVGYIFDHAVKTRSERVNLSTDVGIGGIVHVGTDIVPINATTTTQAWKSQNNLLSNIGFAKSDSTFQEVYFRNPGEKAINTSSFYKLLGGDSLVRIKLGGSDDNVSALSTLTKFSQAKPAGEKTISGPLRKQQRDKRSQVISYLNAADASSYGLDKNIRSYDTSRNPVTGCDSAYTIIPRIDGTVRKGHHLSEIKVLNGDGRIYVYGLPVYNVEQRDVTFAVDKSTNTGDYNKGLISYSAGDNSTNNQKGKDNYFNKDSTPAYAHSFLLTGLLSPDYVDIKGDGITDDDLGDAVKFNYSELYGANNGYYGWRTPFDTNKANYNEGLKTYSRDDKGTYMYGKKEVWYLHSIESKTMIALFRTSDRTDAFSIADENGNKDQTKKLKRLDSIELYTKADLVKSGNNALPVKTVHFEYSYELCQNATGEGTGGKLTLKKIWFTYNGNNKGKLNPYQFYYHPDANNGNLPVAASNPSYNAKTYDRWGNYKDPASNPGGLNNIDYPYAVQDSTKSATYVSAWHLTDIKLPSGGRMHVTFEGDDYAYVQDKRATQFFSIAGFSTTNTNPQKYLYIDQASDCYYVFANVTQSVNNRGDIYTKYLDGIEKIYFKVAVKMPTDRWGSGYEFVPTYGEIDDYGTVSGNNKRFWIKLKAVGGQSPITKAAIQFLRLNLTSKAYPTSELGDDIDLGGAVKMLASSFTEIKNSVEGFDKASMSKKWCREMIDSISFIRLDNPDYKKYGGGIRVKKVEIYDNWNAMTTRSASAGLKESVYGQVYTYTTTKQINGSPVTISSGVASYEPMLGAEENPFRQPIEYVDKVAPLAPANYMYTETPMCESFFPSPMVGYSKVRVRTINTKVKSANGWDETEFYTTKDFPTRVEFTPLDGDSKKRYNPKLRNLLKINAKQFVTVSQGFKIELNDMNGKIKSQASYPENDSVNPVHYMATYYKTDNSRAYNLHLNNRVWAADSASGHIDTAAEIGHEVEMMVDVRQQRSLTSTLNVSVNVDVVFPFIVPWVPFLVAPSVWAFPQKEDNRFRSIAVTKVVQRYGIVDSIVVRDKGSVVSTKNLVFDGETGNVLVTRTNNEFNDPIYSFNYPAHWAYTGMGMAYKNIDAVYTDKKIIDGRLMEKNGTVIAADKYFESGDEIAAIGTRRISQTSQVNDCPTDNFDDHIDSVRLWAINAAKAKISGKGIYFIDSLGRPYSGKDVSLRIIRSGKRNFTDVFVGGITSLANPVREVATGNFRVVIDSSTRVINTTAATFKDIWKVENSLYQTDSCVSVTSVGHAYSLYPVHTMTLLSTNPFAKNQANPENLFLRDKVVASYSASQAHGDIQNHITRAILKFDLSSIPADATITSAKINLYGQKPGDIWGFGLWKSDPTYSYEGIRESFDGNLFSYPYPWDGVTQPGFWQWSYDYTKPGLAKAILPYQGSTNDCINFTNVNCASVIQDLIAKPANMQNLILKINNEWYTNGGSTEIRFMSFCGRSSFWGSKAGEVCATCFPGMLDIDYTYTKDTCYKVCRYNINDSSVNPYRWGILGNWRPDRAYTYYYDRKESDAGVTATDIRKEGELKSFIPYWQLGNDSITPAKDSSRWVWNSASSLYNRKGYETENYDPLGRYNSGLYGYNKTLPVAVAQNSKYREILFDGFEDYSYTANSCNAPCQTPREFDFLAGNSNASIQNVISHSGRNSLTVTANNQAVLTATVTKDTLLTAAVLFSADSTPVYQTSIIGKGTGLSATYRCVGVPGTPITRTEGPIHFTYSGVTLPVCTDTDPRRERFRGYTVTWTGKIQPAFTDYYTFYVNSTESQAGIKIGTQVILNQLMGSTGNRASARIYLEAGKLYDITIDYPRFSKPGGIIDVSWSSAQFQTKQTIPQANLYPPTITATDTMGSINKTIIKYCISPTKVKTENIIHPVFSPIAGSRITASVWINTNAADCNNPTNNPVPEGLAIVSFEGSPVKDTLVKTGVAIDGWQRYETFIDVPATATKMYVTLKANNANATYFDDIRIHPYNSNMKSFVYDPVNLRLMAELDENNYASFYEYDDDGTLIRVKKETERGIKTIKESRSALFKDE